MRTYSQLLANTSPRLSALQQQPSLHEDHHETEQPHQSYPIKSGIKRRFLSLAIHYSFAIEKNCNICTPLSPFDKQKSMGVACNKHNVFAMDR